MRWKKLTLKGEIDTINNRVAGTLRKEKNLLHLQKRLEDKYTSDT